MRVGRKPRTAIVCARRSISVFLLLVLIGLSGFLPGITSGATASSPPAWSAPVNIDGSNEPTSVSCTSPTFCVVVDTSGNAITWNGVRWSAPAGTGAPNSIFSVSCASRRFCAAVGHSGSAQTWNGTGWSGSSIISSGSVNGVSCTSPTFCVAVDDGGNAVTWKGKAWSRPVNVDPAKGALYGVSCSSSRFCVAVGIAGHAAVWDGTSWSPPAAVAGLHLLIGVSCVSPSFCVAVGTGGGPVQWNGSSWSAPAPIDLPGITTMPAVSCVSPSFCVAVSLGGSVVRWDGTAWSPPVDLHVNFPFGPLYGVSCSSPAFCVAVDGSGNARTFASLAVITSSLPGGTVGHAYSASLRAIGGSAPYRWTIAGGSLPPGLTLNPATGVIAGSPTAAGTAALTVQVSDSASPTRGTATMSLSLAIVNPPLTISVRGVRVGQGNASPTMLYSHPSVSRVRVGQKVKLVVYGSLAGLRAGSVRISIAFRVTSGRRTIFFRKTSASLLRADVGKVLSWSAFLTPQSPGVYAFSGTLSLGQKRQQKTVSFTVVRSQGR